MITEFVKNGSPEGVKLNQIFEYLEAAMPKDRAFKSQKRLIGRLLAELKKSGILNTVRRKWFVP